MISLTEDLDALYADFGVEVIYTPHDGGPARTGLAILDGPGREVIDGEIIATDYVLRFPAKTFPVVRRLDTFAIGGDVFIAREDAQPLMDGLERIVPLARSS